MSLPLTPLCAVVAATYYYHNLTVKNMVIFWFGRQIKKDFKFICHEPSNYRSDRYSTTYEEFMSYRELNSLASTGYILGSKKRPLMGYRDKELWEKIIEDANHCLYDLIPEKR